MRVGREPLDEQAIRLIEKHHPDIEFDWPQILKGRGEESRPESGPDSTAGSLNRRRRRRRGRGDSADFAGSGARSPSATYGEPDVEQSGSVETADAPAEQNGTAEREARQPGPQEDPAVG